jgi:hypothetical protein
VTPAAAGEMHIKEVCLEGFKSYAGRTVVSGFDPLFNAITGLNGSGKSNILDSICFVLGITDLRQVRAASLQELVYKQGQAGVTKATVSIVFDNSDRSRSPLGYEDSPEITVTRQVTHPCRILRYAMPPSEASLCSCVFQFLGDFSCDFRSHATILPFLTRPRSPSYLFTDES